MSNKKLSEQVSYIRGLHQAILGGLATTFEERRKEVGVEAARLDTLAAVTCVVEAVYFCLGHRGDNLPAILAAGAVYRLDGMEMPELKLSDDAVRELIPVIAREHADSL